VSSALLTEEEIAALRQETRGGPKTAEDVNLNSAERSLRRLMPQLETRLGNFIEQQELSLGCTLRRQWRAASVQMEVTGPGTARDALRDCVMVASLRTPHGLVGYLGIRLDFAWQLVETFFGAVGSNTDTQAGWLPPRRRLSEIERRTLSPHFEQIAKMMAEGLGCTSQLEPEDTSGFGPSFPREVEALVSWTVSEAERTPAFFAALLPNIDECLGVAAKVPVASARGWIANHLNGASVEVSAVLGVAEMSLERLLSLSPGDIVRLDRSQYDLVPVLIEGISKFLAKPMPRHGAVGVEIQAEAK